VTYIHVVLFFICYVSISDNQGLLCATFDYNLFIHALSIYCANKYVDDLFSSGCPFGHYYEGLLFFFLSSIFKTQVNDLGLRNNS